jgi:hypothetical protein
VEQQESRFFTRLSYVYLYVPVLIFLVGWLKTSWWVLLLVLLSYPTYRLFQQAPQVWVPNFRAKRTYVYLGVAVLLAALWVYLSGIGGLSFQNFDFKGRNGVFEALVNRPWPVRFSTSHQAPLVYYFGFWLPAAGLGKVFGLPVGLHFQAVWAVGGVLLCYYLICAQRRQLAVWPLLVLIFFSGADILAKVITLQDLAQVTLTSHLEWTTPYQYSSFTTQLYWVFNQALPSWLIFLLLKTMRQNRQLLAVFGVGLLYGPLPLLGLVPFVGYWALQHLRQKTGLWWRDLITWENGLGLVLMVVLGLFITANQVSSEIHLNLPQGLTQWGYYGAFIVTEVGLYAVLLWRQNWRNPEFGLLLVILLLCPFFKIGTGPDFVMRVSIPALLMLCLLVQQALANSVTQPRQLICLLVVFGLGAVTPTHEILRAVNYDRDRYVAKVNQRPFQDNQRHLEYAVPIDRQPDYRQNILGKRQAFFFRYLAR